MTAHSDMAQRMTHNTSRRALLGLAVLLPVAALTGLIWLFTLSWVGDQRQAAQAQIAATAEGDAALLAAQVDRQLTDIDQTLRILVRAWQADPAHFDLQAWRDVSVSLAEVSQDMMLADNRGLVVQSSIPEAVGLDVSTRDYFRYALEHGRTVDQAFVGQATVSQFMRQWHLSVVRWMRNPDRSFGGVIIADYRVNALQDLFQKLDLGRQGLVALIGLHDGRLRAAVGGPITTPDESVAETPMFAALQAAPDGIWVGHSAADGIERAHGFHQIPGRDLAVVVGIGLQAALAAEDAWETRLVLYAAGITGLMLLIAGLVFWWAERSHRRQQALSHERARQAAGGAQLEVARSRADAKAAQLEATLTGMSDGVAMVDAQFCLVEWNQRFPEIAGVPAYLLRVGLPMEDVLRAQVESGQFGAVDVEHEVARRMALLRLMDRPGTRERTRPDGRTIELQRNPLPDGGFVTLYRDVTARRQAEQAMREARELAEAAAAAKSRFVAIVSHEIRTPLGALLNTLRLLGDGNLTASQQVLLRMARQSGDALFGLINDILDMSSMEAGQLTLRPSVFMLEPLLEGVVEMFHAQAAERSITLSLRPDDDLPTELYTDPGRLRQVLINLLSNAVKYGLPGEVALLARREHDQLGRALLRVAVRDRGPLIEEAGRARLFQPFSRLDMVGDAPMGTGLGLAICRYLVTMMGGEINCETWLAEDGRGGNEFWMRLPLVPIPAGARPSVSSPDAPPRLLLPRSRVLLVEDILANQLITATLLRREGHMVDVAATGEAAIQAVSRQPYDLAFVDIYMPGMSGLDAARQIRTMAGAAGGMPIIALSANVDADDKLECQRAGMNDLLSKPVALPDLLRALARHVWHGRPERHASVTRAVSPTVPSVLAEARLGELRHLLPADALSNMVEECLVELQSRLPALRRALQDGAGTEAVNQAHAMVGMAAGYGMATLERHLRAVMLTARGPDSEATAAALVDQLETDLAHAAAALREALQIELV